MRMWILASLLTFSLLISCKQSETQPSPHYLGNRSPLVETNYLPLPLGSIQPQKWLHHMLELQRDGLSGNLDSVYELVCGPNNGWLGGYGDSWERGPYWLDGLVPLAYILNDENLKKKAQQWIDWAIDNQRENGYFGPLPLPQDAPKIRGTQQNMSEDWWPKMVMLKVLQQYYSATEDERVIQLMDRYFRYQLEHLDEFPLGHWTYWANRRGGDNLAVVYWLYNKTGESYLLDLAQKIHEQTFNWTQVFSDGTINNLNPHPDLHCVNVAQGLKEPVIYYQQNPDSIYLNAVKAGLQALKQSHGFVNGMYGGDEHLHGNDPTQGSELCSAVEMMFSFESMLPITGDVYYADYLEKVAYNVLPTQHNDDFTKKQYYQQVNQVEVKLGQHNFKDDYIGSIVYGVLTGYPCCVSNMHQGWPKFVQNLWYATADRGVAALVYGPSEVTLKVADGEEVTILEETDYPFRDEIKFTIGDADNLAFPFHLRIPAWCESATVLVNGQEEKTSTGNEIVVLKRQWNTGDVILLKLPMKIKFSRWYEESAGVERGLLVYALKLDEKWEETTHPEYPNTLFEVTTSEPWNWALNEKDLDEKAFVYEENQAVGLMPWNLENAPVSLTTTGYSLPVWKLYNGSAGKIPSPSIISREINEAKQITLIPYGCTTLRIAEFPVIDK